MAKEILKYSPENFQKNYVTEMVIVTVNDVTLLSNPIKGQLAFNKNAKTISGKPDLVANELYYFNGTNWISATMGVRNIVPENPQNDNPINVSWDYNKVAYLNIYQERIIHGNLGGLLAEVNPHNVDLKDTLEQDPSAGNIIITDHPEPQNDTDVVNKKYVDRLTSGGGANWKTMVRVASTANISDPFTISVGDTIDGISLVADDRVLIKDQNTNTQNGIYVVGASASTRATDCDESIEFKGATVMVQKGTQANSTWFQQLTVIATDPMPVANEWIKVGETAGQLGAGDGLGSNGTEYYAKVKNGLEIVSDFIQVKASDIATSKSGLKVGISSYSLALNVDDVTTEVPLASGKLQVKEKGIEAKHLNKNVPGKGMTGGDGNRLEVLPYDQNNPGINPTIMPAYVGAGKPDDNPSTNDSGVGVRVDNDTIKWKNGTNGPELYVNTAASFVIKKFATAVNLSAGVSTNVTHSLESTDIIVQVWKPTSGTIYEMIDVYFETVDGMAISITSSISISNARVVVIG